MSARSLLSVGEALKTSMLKLCDNMRGANHLVLVRHSCGIFLSSSVCNSRLSFFVSFCAEGAPYGAQPLKCMVRGTQPSVGEPAVDDGCAGPAAAPCLKLSMSRRICDLR